MKNELKENEKVFIIKSSLYFHSIKKVLDTIPTKNIEDNSTEQTSKEYESSLKHALKNKNNIIEKARIYTENKIFYKRKLKLEKQKKSNNNNINNKNNENQAPVILETNSYLDFKIKENFSKDLISDSKNHLTKYKNFNQRDELEIVHVVPKSSLLRVDENKFLSFREIQKEIKKKEIESYQKSIETLAKNSQSLTPFQYNEILKNLHKDNIKSKQDKVLNQAESEQNLKEGEVLINNLNKLNSQKIFDQKTKHFHKNKHVLDFKEARRALKLPKISFLSEQSDCDLKSFDAVLLNCNEESSHRNNYNGSKKDKESIISYNSRKYKENLDLKDYVNNSIQNNLKPSENKNSANKEQNRLDFSKALIKPTSSNRSQKEQSSNNQNGNNLIGIKKNVLDFSENKVKLNKCKNSNDSADFKSPSKLVISDLIGLVQKNSLLKNKNLFQNPFNEQEVKLFSNNKQSYNSYVQQNLIVNNKEIFSPKIIQKISVNQSKTRNAQKGRLIINPYPYNLSNLPDKAKIKINSKTDFDLASVKNPKLINNNNFSVPLINITSPKPISLKIKSNVHFKANALKQNSVEFDSLNETQSIKFEINKLKVKLNDFSVDNNKNRDKNILNLKENSRHDDFIDGIKIEKKINFSNMNKTKFGISGINYNSKNQNSDIQHFL